ncbi:sporulation protein YunB [Alkalihalophilus pseudofirmus]|uniref:Sporulation protein YunB n=1 Tax=Alkalihalophilus pseudofirmus TaxID=79885 RepID=A0AAJ2KVA4_ALKPS|nr:sporulation protein YunB [Alkalihalophilus pseudofirmus]MDV2883660.1 sporulation protein YunB [Alkalihalophilus pseudofirmus]WEG17789.1 sporulation protein YunB [Alkalihalophilus pseudofirmus]
MRTFKYKPRKKRGPLPFRYVFILSIILFVALTIWGLWIIEKGIKPTLLQIATTETRVIATQAINDAVSKKIVSELDQAELFIIETDADNKVTSMQFNTQVYNRVLSEATNRVQRHLKAIEHGEPFDIYSGSEGEVHTSDGGVVYDIPLGQATNNALLAQMGPRIPVRFSVIGDVKTDFHREVINTGINNTTLIFGIDITVDVKIVIPFATDTQAIHTVIPIGVRTIQGEVPEYYSESGGMIVPAVSAGE